MTKIFAIIVNFHSDEKVADLVKTLQPAVAKTIVIDNSENNRGFAKAVNLGIKQALKEKADSILLVNPDVKISPDQVVELAKTSGDIVAPVLTFSRLGKTIFDFGGRVNWFLGRSTHLEENSLVRSHLLRRGLPDFVSGACILIRNNVFKKIGLFDERFFMYFEDVDFCLRAKKAGFSVVVNSDVVVSHEISEHRLTKDAQKTAYILQSNMRFINKWVAWYFRPLAYLYYLLLRLKVAIT